ncbi:Membrane-bound lytic murein transglycosylase D precursor [Helicobacter heilmannii]|uniref:lytic transglycosylase domain-containing protein n=1 Tax=Helicobacter heilmannii TaxID=35817 RepID=UPI0006A17F00|nr:lytic transglycosylase domain-containing protein [Helicobacter heilmannii]CRF47709.1 Membrane-bound lytic murein transglycosylase D precursor [Helicobacter heilmannii]
MLKNLLQPLSFVCLLSLSLCAAPPTINSTSLKTLNAFGVDADFLANSANANTLESVQQTFDRLLQHYDANGVFIPTIKSMLLQANVPVEFLFLAMAESKFSVRAYSVKKAVGIWQFMPETAKMLGLKVDALVDERRDPIKSTQAAITYFKMLYQKTHQWYLVAMAYNYGLRRVLEAIQAAGTDNINVLLDEHKKYLPQETRHYIRSILSLAIAFNNLDTEGKKAYLLNRGARQTLASVQVKGGTLLSQVASAARLSVATVRAYNHQFRYNFAPTGISSTVYIPYENLAYFRQHYKPKSYIVRILSHRVKPKETLYSIARKFHSSVALLRYTNNLKGFYLSRKQKLIIPVLSSKVHRLKVAQNEVL